MNKKINKSNDHYLDAIPKNERKSFWSITMVWTGFVFVIASMMAGGGLSAGLNMKDIILVTILGNIFLSTVAILVSTIATKTGLSFALISKYSFGDKGSRVASIFIPIVNIGWYTIQSAIYGHFIALILNLNPTGEYIAMILSALVMGIFALIGISALTVLGFVAIPAIIFLSLATAIKATGMAGGISSIMSIEPKNPMTLLDGLTIIIGTWIFSASTCIADIMRYSKNTKEATISTLTGLVFGNSLLIICGAITSFALQDSDLTSVLLKMGLIIPSFILMTTNIFTTNGANIYSTGLNLANAFKKESSKIITVVLIISALLTLTKPYEIDSLFKFLGFLGNAIPPLPGIILADYYLINKGNYINLSHCKIAPWNIIAWIAWILSAVIVMVVDFGFAPLNGIILGSLIYTVLMKLTKKIVITVN